jgi:hypothetical protein
VLGRFILRQTLIANNYYRIAPATTVSKRGIQVMKFFKNGDLSIFVVNHHRDGHFVEFFDYRGGKLVHRISPDGQTVYVAATVGQKILYNTFKKTYHSITQNVYT